MDLRPRCYLQWLAQGHLFTCIISLICMADIITGSPFVGRSVASRFLGSGQPARAKHIRSTQQRGQQSALMELEGWQELLTYKKRNDIPSADRLRTIEKLRETRTLILQVLEDTQQSESRATSTGKINPEKIHRDSQGSILGTQNHQVQRGTNAEGSNPRAYHVPSRGGKEGDQDGEDLGVWEDVSAQLRALDKSDLDRDGPRD